ncbi:hypothetical protein XENORESO_006738 [Xenotaenia resolanae]|uniref:Cytochrome c oxidase copper chaperone n=1 Tax=Xenotaenia resolanae TaxID=208358 RepID=A0ABV0WJ10_9TELE
MSYITAKKPMKPTSKGFSVAEEGNFQITHIRNDQNKLHVHILRHFTCSKMSSLSAASVEAPAVTDGAGQKKPLKPCCACPETKKVRDACIIEKGEENCRDLIEAHKECMRSLGFKI